jgi:DNA modification methylase
MPQTCGIIFGPDLQMNRNVILQGDSLAVLKTLPSASVDMIFTSPPYLALRDYKVEGQIGLEQTSKHYLDRLFAVFDEAKRVLKDMGTCWVNLGDTFAGSGKGGDPKKKAVYTDNYDSKVLQRKWKQDTYRHLQDDPEAHRRNTIHESNLPTKCLMMIPERFAWGMIERDWILRAKIIWFKPNGMIESSKDRPKLDYEMLYMFSKKQRYWFNYIEAKRPLKSESIARKLRNSETNTRTEERFGSDAFGPKKWAFVGGPKIGGTKHSGNNGNESYSGNEWKPHDGMAKMGSVWSIAPKTFGHEYCETCDKLVKSRDLLFKCKECQTVYEKIENCSQCKSAKRELVCPTCKTKVHMHFAMFPEELVLPALRMTCPDQVCSECGVPRFPVYTPTEEYAKLLGKGWHDHSDDEEAGMQQEKEIPVSTADYRIKEWTKCSCGAPFVPGVIFDPFMGFGTVAAVAMKNGRDFLGIDLDTRNVKAAIKRVEPYILQTRIV